jgi:hypothetical protein
MEKKRTTRIHPVEPRSCRGLLAFETANVEKIASAQMAVIYCGDENCGISRQVAARIRQLNLGPQISALNGGWRALKDAGMVKD